MNRIYFSVWRTKCNELGMTLTSWRSALLAAALSFGAAVSVITTSPPVFAQETTGGLQGTIKDASGAVVPGATVTVTTPSLPGGKSATTDSKGYYHFSNLPPGAYLITVEAKGFSELKREGLVLEVGHDPTLDLTLAVGAENAEVEVSSASPQIDVTSVTTQTNITQDVVNYVPHGTSFQSVIQFAPDASNEPLMGNTGGTGAPGSNQGSGGTSPG